MEQEFSRARDLKFRSRVNKLMRKAPAARIECNAQVVLIAVSPDDYRVEIYASPPGMNEILGSVGHEPRDTGMDPTVRFEQALHNATVDVTQLSTEDLVYLRTRLTNMAAAANAERQ